MNKVVKILREGGIILYPTEGVFGLGCDPLNETAVIRILKLKKRSVNKGLILIAASWYQAQKFVKVDILKNYPSVNSAKEVTTWVFPASKLVPKWITGRFNTVAIRVTKHPVAKKICQQFGGVIVSTSANVASYPAPTTRRKIAAEISAGVDMIVPGLLGRLGKPTKIRDLTKCVDVRN